MKKILGLMLTLMLFACGTEEKINKTDVEKSGLKGKVKSETVLIYLAVENFGEVKKGEIMSSSTTFYNEKGFKTRYNYESNYGKSKSTYEYDDSGLLTKVTVKNENDEHRIFLYKYDDVDRVSNILRYESDGALINENKFTYDRKGNVIEDTTYDKNKEVVEKIKKKYDRNGRLKEIIFPSVKTVHKHTKDGMIDSVTSYYLDTGKIENVYKYDYIAKDDKNNLVKEIMYLNDSPLSVTETKIKYY